MTHAPSDPILASASWPAPADPRLLALGWDRWNERNRDLDWTDTDLLSALFGNSPFLTDCAIKEPEVLRSLQAHGPDRTFSDIVDALWLEHADTCQEPLLMQALRTAKRQVALLVAVADIGALWTLDEVTDALSRFADAALRLTCRHCLRVTAEGGAFKLHDPADPEHHSGLIILGMGKLGASELNYSSDIDLIVLYDPDRIVTDDVDRLPRAMIRLVRAIVRIMEDRTPDGYVFRTDLRLRPDPGATPLAVNLAAAENYYASLAQNWERAAMIKARPIAGDLVAGDDFLAFLQPFIWRRNLDFVALQDIHNIKNQLDRKASDGTEMLEGHDLKIGRGGIREIEFFAQTQQLIYGGRDPRLRGRRTVDTLRVLADVGRIDMATQNDLSAAYQWLRRVEHRIQMIDDHQTHRMPDTADGVARLACFLGDNGPAGFRAELGTTLATVEHHFRRMFADAPDDDSGLVFIGIEDVPGTEKALRVLGFQQPERVVETVRGWLHGRYRACRSNQARALLTELLPQLLGAIGRAPFPDATFARFDKFLGGLPAGIQLFSMFRANPGLLDFVSELLGTSDRMADHLARNPQELDAVLTPGFFDRLPSQEELAAEIERMLAPAQVHEDELNILRQWTRDHRFRAGAHLIRGTTTGDRLGPYLTAVAEIGLAALQRCVSEEFARKYGRFGDSGLAIVALGKLGSGEMSIQSDLDLIMVFDAHDQTQSDGAKPLGPTVYFTRLIQRLVSAITAHTVEGALYEVDMRLRPSGNAGPLATGLEAFVRYHRESAWTWEHMALTRARCITGTPAMKQTLAKYLRNILTQQRDADALYRDVASMRARIDKEHGQTSPWAVKHVRGGLVDIEFIAQCLQLRHAADRPDVLDPNTGTALRNLGGAGILTDTQVDELTAVLEMNHRITAYLRLVNGGALDVTTAAPSILLGLARACFPSDAPSDFDALERRVRDHQDRAATLYAELVEEPAKQAGWPDRDS